MGVPYNDAGFELKFLGVMNGNSDSHTNAFFYPDEETLVFIDMSLYNYKKASKMIDDGVGKLKRVILFLTHMHVDHASGVVSLAYYVRERLPGIRLEVVAGSYYVQDACRMFFAEGAKSLLERNGKRDDVVRIFGMTLDNRVLVRWDDTMELLVNQGLIDKEYRFVIPEWFIRVIPTTHSPRLSGAGGFSFKLNEKIIIFSGDTNTADHFLDMAERYASTDYNHLESIPVELYLDMEINAFTNHLSWDKMKTPLLNFVRRTGNVKIALMHYDDAETLAREVELFNAQNSKQLLFLAEEA